MLLKLHQFERSYVLPGEWHGFRAGFRLALGINLRAHCRYTHHAHVLTRHMLDRTMYVGMKMIMFWGCPSLAGVSAAHARMT